MVLEKLNYWYTRNGYYCAIKSTDSLTYWHNFRSYYLYIFGFLNNTSFCVSSCIVWKCFAHDLLLCHLFIRSVSHVPLIYLSWKNLQILRKRFLILFLALILCSKNIKNFFGSVTFLSTWSWNTHRQNNILKFSKLLCKFNLNICLQLKYWNLILLYTNLF